jgi:hypothetical protein
VSFLGVVEFVSRMVFNFIHGVYTDISHLLYPLLYSCFSFLIPLGVLAFGGSSGAFNRDRVGVAE